MMYVIIKVFLKTKIKRKKSHQDNVKDMNGMVMSKLGLKMLKLGMTSIYCKNIFYQDFACILCL